MERFNQALAKADSAAVATACAHRSATVTAEAAAVLGRHAECDEFRAMAADLRRTFVAHHVDDGRGRSDCATVYALAVVFGLLDGDDLACAGDRLAELVAESSFPVSTGFAGTRSSPTRSP